MKPFAGLVGGWERGVGQVERGRVKGAWTESAAWAWKLTNDSAALEVKVAKGKYLRSVTLTSTMGPGVKVDPSRTRDIIGEGQAETVAA